MQKISASTRAGSGATTTSSTEYGTPEVSALTLPALNPAYTVQTNIAPNHTGRFLPHVKPGWNYSAPLAPPHLSPILVDGAKRDRAVWPGDLGVAIPSCLVAFGPQLGWPAVKNALETMMVYQFEDGMMPFAGPSTMSQRNGTRGLGYHFWCLIGFKLVWDWGREGQNLVKLVSPGAGEREDLTRSTGRPSSGPWSIVWGRSVKTA